MRNPTATARLHCCLSAPEHPAAAVEPFQAIGFTDRSGTCPLRLDDRHPTGKSRRERAPFDSDPDIILMLRVQQDDPTAFAELLARHRSRVWRYLRMWVGNQDDADDLAQEVFLKVYRYRKTYRPQARFNTWLYHIVRNVARNALRTRRRRPVLPLGIRPPEETVDSGADADQSAVFFARTEEEPSRPLERAEMQAQVREALRHLQARYRQALILRQFGGCSHAEIAAELCLTAKAAKSLLYRARLEMRNVLRAYMLAE